MAEEPILLTDDPAPHVRRITLNRPNKRNALSNALRAEIFKALEAADADPEVRVMIIRGAGPCFSQATTSPISAPRPTTPPAPRAPGRATSSKAASRSGTWPSR
jgi:hypothetical protein